MGIFKSFFARNEMHIKDKINLGFHAGGVSALAITNKNVISASTDDFDIKIWDIEINKESGRFTEHQKKIVGLAISDDQTQVASIDDDNTLFIWDINLKISLHKIKPAQPVKSLAFQPVSDCLYLGGKDGSITVIKNTTGIQSKILTLSPEVIKKLPKEQAKEIKRMGFSRDGSLLAAINDDGAVILWDLTKDTVMSVISSAPYSYDYAIFSPDNKYLVASGGRFTLSIRITVQGTFMEANTSEFGGVLSIFEPSTQNHKKLISKNFLYNQCTMTADNSGLIVLTSLGTLKKINLEKTLFYYSMDSLLNGEDEVLNKPKDKKFLGTEFPYSMAVFSPNLHYLAMPLEKNLYLWTIEI